MRDFRSRLEAAWARRGSLVCVGLDPEIERFPRALAGVPAPIYEFNKAIIDATADAVCAFKPQFAHYAAYAAEDQLERTIDYIHRQHPGILVILDAKRGDVGHTAQRYAAEAFERYGADAVTVNPYLGLDSLEPFLEYGDRGTFVLCRTSNPGARDLQDLQVGDAGGDAAGAAPGAALGPALGVASIAPATPTWAGWRPNESRPAPGAASIARAADPARPSAAPGRRLYQAVAELAATRWNKRGNCGLVVGATYPAELGEVRSIVGDLPLLVPGIGAQGGDVEQAVRQGCDSAGTGLLISSSRAVLYAAAGDDFADAARTAAQSLKETIDRYRRAGV